MPPCATNLIEVIGVSGPETTELTQNSRVEACGTVILPGIGSVEAVRVY